MPRAKVTDGLSAAAQRIMAQGFAQAWTAARIAQAVKDATGEEVAARTVSRRAAEWRGERDRRQGARERMADLVAAMRAGGMEASEMIQALAMDHLVEHPEALTGADPVELQGLSINSEKVRLKRRELDIRERSVLVNEKKMALLEAREQRAIAAVSGGDEKMTPEERVKEIRAIYGLRELAEA